MKTQTKKRKAFTLTGPKDHEGNNNSRRERTHRDAFTLIELIVVMAVIGILVLLAAPKFMGYTQKAQETKHIHTAKVIETALEAYLINGGAFPDDLEVIAKTLLEEAADKNTLIGVNGYVATVNDETYYELTYDFIQKLDVKLSAKNQLFVEALASSVPTAVYASEKGIALVDKEKQIKGYPGQSNTIIEEDSVESLVKQGYFEIRTPEDFDNIRDNLSGKYVISDTIDLSSFTNWVPIGSEQFPFNGIVKGLNQSIINLKINRPFEENIGLFGYVGVDGILDNIQLVNVSIVGKGNVGSFSGFNYGNANKLVVSGNISGDRYDIGGISGKNYGNITLSKSSANITATNGGGGIVGTNLGIIETSLFVGTVTGSGSTSYRGYFGGMTGANHGIIQNCYTTGIINGYSSPVGGISGQNIKSFSRETDIGLILNSYSIGKTTGTSPGGVSGNNRDLGRIENSYWNINTSGVLTSPYGVGLTSENMKKQESYTNWDFDNVWTIIEGESYPTLIDNPLP